jgi:hypothetical protein
MLSWYNFEEELVVSYCLDIDGVGSTKSEDAAEGINNSLLKLSSVLLFFSQQNTNSGGGGVLENLMLWLIPLGLVNPGVQDGIVLYHACFMLCRYPLVMVLKLSMVKVVLINVMQLIHSCYNLRRCLGRKECHLFWEIATKMPPPNAMSREYCHQSPKEVVH